MAYKDVIREADGTLRPFPADDVGVYRPSRTKAVIAGVVYEVVKRIRDDNPMVAIWEARPH